MDESQIIPFASSPLPPGPWLVFAPHYDDEVFGMGGTILLAAEQGIDVDIVFMTDGAADESTTTRIREQEAKAACETLGIRQHHLLREPDRALCQTDELVSRVSELISQCAPSAVFFPSPLEAHPDHRHTADIVWSAATCTGVPVPRMLCYEILYQGPCNTLVDISHVKGKKRNAMSCYDSQISHTRYIEHVEHINGARALTLGGNCVAAEGFYLIDWYPGLTLQHTMQYWLDRFFYQDESGLPLVSVIIRTKDRRRLLIQAIASLANQRYRHLELIVVNDNGEDVSDVVDTYRNAFTAIQYTVTSTTGRSAAANLGMELASGKLFMFLDDDDWLDPAHIANLVAAHNDPDTVVAYAGVRAANGDPSDSIEPRVFNTPFDKTRMYWDNFIPIHAALIKRSVIDQGYRFDESLEAYEDWDFWLQLCQITPAFKHLDDITAYYRIGGDHGFGLRGGNDHLRRRIYGRWAKTWGIDEIEEILSRLARHS